MTEDKRQRNYKAELQEYLQQTHSGELPVYTTKYVGGPAHDPRWQSCVMTRYHKPPGMKGNVCSTKVSAENSAAELTLVTLLLAAKEERTRAWKEVVPARPLVLLSPADFQSDAVVGEEQKATIKPEALLTKPATTVVLVDFENQPHALTVLDMDWGAIRPDIHVFLSSTHHKATARFPEWVTIHVAHSWSKRRH